MKYLNLIILLWFVGPTGPALASQELDSLYVLLVETMNQRQQYQDLKENKIRGLKSLLKTDELNEEQQFYINSKLFEEFLPFNFDSALHYINLNLSLAHKLQAQAFRDESNLHLANLLAYSGRYLEALDVVRKVSRANLSPRGSQEYYSIYAKVYAELYLFTPARENSAYYRGLYRNYADTLMGLLDKNSEDYLALLEKEYRDNRRLSDCRRINSQRLAMAEMGTRTYSTVAFERAIMYQLENNIEEEKKYLVLSAISDIKAAIKDNASLTDLAMLLFKDDKIDKAYRYIMFSFEDAAFYNSRLRYIQISNILPLISEAYQLKTNRQKAELRKFLWVISLLSLILLVAIVAIFHQIRSLRKAKNELLNANERLTLLNDSLTAANAELNKVNKDLIETDQVKEHYIGSFLAICSDYIDKLDDFRKMVNKNIVAHKVDELYAATKSKKLIDKEIEDFYSSFDNIFLHLFPDFVDQINNLLLEEARLHLKKEDSLPTEIRILALIRLGIKDSSKIAHLLRYSVNTIYNYRVKIKNKAAVHRDEFEDYVMKIGTQMK